MFQLIFSLVLYFYIYLIFPPPFLISNLNFELSGLSAIPYLES